MFINNVVTKIWEPVTQEYGRLYNEAMQLTEDELYNVILDRLKGVDNFLLNTRELNMTRLLTTGCPHNHKNGKFSGCSMCDYMSFHLDMLAMVCALKDRDQKLYAKAVRYSFDNVRGKSPKPGTVELITGHDCLNPDEIPDETFDELFNKESLFGRKPYKTIFETRINSITYDRLAKWKEKLGKKVTVEVGIEVWDEWVRNHWINKNVFQNEISEALDIVEKTGCELSANILIGMPGLTEDISIQLFKETYFKLDELGVNYILCSPLSRKEKTLQGYIYKNMKNNKILVDAGLVNGEETGMPSFFTVMDAICSVLEEKPDSLPRMTLSPANFPVYFEIVKKNYQGNAAMEECLDFAIDALKRFSIDKDFQRFANARLTLSKTDSYKEYEKFKNKQNELGSLRNVLNVLGTELAKDLWPNEWENQMQSFIDEMKLIDKGL